MELEMGRNYIKSGFSYTDIHSHPSDNKNVFNHYPMGNSQIKASWNGAWQNYVGSISLKGRARRETKHVNLRSQGWKKNKRLFRKVRWKPGQRSIVEITEEKNQEGDVNNKDDLAFSLIM